MLCGNVLDWPAKCAVSGFVFGAVFWAAFFMPAAARAQNLPSAPWALFGPQNFRFWGRAFGSKFLFICLLCLPTPATSFRPILVAGFPARSAGPKN